MIEIEEFETTESTTKPTFIQHLIATLKCWQWGAMHSPKFDDFYWGLNQSPIEINVISGNRFTVFSMAFYSRIWLMTCIPYSAITDYRQATQSDISLIWK
jgi:cellulose synthase/poly-beta-1,6-N-acetylglucosamine synthase-like glycosyltransferase